MSIYACIIVFLHKYRCKTLQLVHTVELTGMGVFVEFLLRGTRIFATAPNALSHIPPLILAKARSKGVKTAFNQ